MKIIEPSVTLYTHCDEGNPLKHIEMCGRVCYKSEDKIADGSASKFVKGIVKRGHLAVTEHFRFIIQVDSLPIARRSKYILGTDYHGRLVASGSSRAFVESYYSVSGKTWEDSEYRSWVLSAIYTIIEHYECPELFGELADKVADMAKDFAFTHCNMRVLKFKNLAPDELAVHGWFTARFICDRGVSHEIVRHRPASYCQESTRYCNYSKDGFGNEITVIKPSFFGEKEFEGPLYTKYGLWKVACRAAERIYMQLLESGARPEEARTVLPNSLKTELMMTATMQEWNHFFALRCSAAAHPQIRELAVQLRDMAVKAYPDCIKEGI